VCVACANTVSYRTHPAPGHCRALHGHSMLFNCTGGPPGPCRRLRVVSVAGTEGDSSVSVAWDPPTLAAGITGYETFCGTYAQSLSEDMLSAAVYVAALASTQ
jgi:hypothetical protein